MSLVEQAGRSATTVALEETQLVWIDRASFWACLQTMPRLGLNLSRILSARLRMANAQIQSLSTLDVYGRVARQLLAFARAYGTTAANGDILIPIRLTQSDLAELIGASRVRVNQVIVVYKRRKYVSVDQHYHVTVHNASALAKRCQL
jgi:CRP/FNR family cyclic AMP-dependent transcriptional regulator